VSYFVYTRATGKTVRFEDNQLDAALKAFHEAISKGSSFATLEWLKDTECEY
jgi:hypothetical protein